MQENYTQSLQNVKLQLVTAFFEYANAQSHMLQQATTDDYLELLEKCAEDIDTFIVSLEVSANDACRRGLYRDTQNLRSRLFNLMNKSGALVEAICHAKRDQDFDTKTNYGIVPVSSVVISGEEIL